MTSRLPVGIAKHTAAARLLGLGPLPSMVEVKEAYRVQAKLFHPDVAADPQHAEAKFHKIRQAYEILQRPTMSETARKLTTPDPQARQQDELRRYHATASSAPIRVMTALLFVMTGALTYKLYVKKAFPHQRGFDVRDLWRERRVR